MASPAHRCSHDWRIVAVTTGAKMAVTTGAMIAVTTAAFNLSPVELHSQFRVGRNLSFLHWKAEQ